MSHAQVRMHTLAAGPAGVMRPGETYRVPREQAEQIVAGGYAEPVGWEPAKASPPPPPPKLPADAKPRDDESASGEDRELRVERDEHAQDGPPETGSERSGRGRPRGRGGK